MSPAKEAEASNLLKLDLSREQSQEDVDGNLG
jgi:hypothetical protein